MKIQRFLYLAAIVLMLGSCSTPKLGYFQDVKSGDVQQLSSGNVIKVQPGDKLSILVSSKNPQLSYMFNLPIVGHYQAAESDATLSLSQVASYTVDEKGDIDFPVLGALHLAGMSRNEVATFVKKSLLDNGMLKDPIVTVSFLDLTFSVMGEVKNPGRFVIDHDRVTLIDALSRAGDLTIFGKRDNVLVVREEDNKQISYRVDLTNAEQLYTSPAFYLKQNDIVYVEPNDMRARESTVSGNTLRTPSFWISVASLLTTISVLIFK